MTPPAQLQHETEILKQAFPDFHALHVENAEGRTIAFAPQVNEKGESTLGHGFLRQTLVSKSPRPNNSRWYPKFSWAGWRFFPPSLVIVSRLSGRINGWAAATGTLDLKRVQEMLQPYSSGKGHGHYAYRFSRPDHCQHGPGAGAHAILGSEKDRGIPTP